MKVKTCFYCSQCAASFSQWSGMCTQCGAWNTILEEHKTVVSPRIANYANQRSSVMALNEVVIDHQTRMDCGLSELNRVLGGGLVDGDYSTLEERGTNSSRRCLDFDGSFRAPNAAPSANLFVPPAAHRGRRMPQRARSSAGVCCFRARGAGKRLMAN